MDFTEWTSKIREVKIQKDEIGFAGQMNHVPPPDKTLGLLRFFTEQFDQITLLTVKNISWLAKNGSGGQELRFSCKISKSPVAA
jgi:hypothetical protein